MDFDRIGSTLLIVLLVVFALIGLLAVVALVIVIVRYRPPFAAIAAVVGALIYGASPVDLIPEAVLGPIGALDDIGLLAAAVGFMVTQVRQRRGIEPAGRTSNGAPRPGASGATRVQPPRLTKDT